MYKLLLIPLALLTGILAVHAQDWKFIKEKDGIKIYTRENKDSDIKSFRGVVDFHCTADKINNLVGNPNRTDWWSGNLKEVKLLATEKEKFNRFYLVYDVPWPLSDRDLVVEATIVTDPVTKIRTVTSVPVTGIIPENPDYVRIKRYWQKWTIQPMADNTTHVTIEGTVDPGGSIPAWLYNMVITDTPLKILHAIQERVEKK